MLILLATFVLLSWWQGKTIVQGALSFATFFLLGLTRFSWPAAYWHAALLEYWLAVAVWFASAVWLVFLLYRAFGAARRAEGNLTPKFVSDLTPAQRKGFWVLAILAYVSLMSPFLVPVGPHIQGNLVSTRLLPPLSIGSIENPSVEPLGHKGGLVAGIERQSQSATEYLLQRTVRMSGTAEPTFSRMIFLMGTDDAGRDVFSRVVYGARVSLGIGLLAALGSILLGSFVGFAAGLSGGIVDTALMRLTDMFLAIPGLFLVIGLVAFLGQSVITVIIVLAFTGWMGIARLVRGEVLSLREKEFVITARMLRVSVFRIIIRHLYPNVRPAIVTAAVLQFGSAVLAEAALGFLGLGIQPPTPSWGNMMGESIGFLQSAWWIGMFPGVFLATVIVSAHLVGESLE